MEIFKNLRNKRAGGTRLLSNEIRALDAASDFNMADDIV